MQLLTVEQAADALGISEKTVRRMLPELGALDLLSGRSQRRMIRIPRESVERYLSSCRITTAVPEKRKHAPRKPKTEPLDLELFEPDGRIKRRRTS